jgi:hypothetical protein
VRGEIDRAVDSVVDALLRRRDPGGH